MALKPNPTSGEKVKNPKSGVSFEYNATIGAYVAGNSQIGAPALLGQSPVMTLDPSVTIDATANTPDPNMFLTGTLVFEEADDKWWQVRYDAGATTKVWHPVVPATGVQSVADAAALNAITGAAEGDLAFVEDLGIPGETSGMMFGFHNGSWEAAVPAVIVPHRLVNNVPDFPPLPGVTAWFQGQRFQTQMDLMTGGLMWTTTVGDNPFLPDVRGHNAGDVLTIIDPANGTFDWRPK